MKIGKLIKDRFFHDDEESGLYFDLYPTKRNVAGEDEDGLNARIDQRNDYLESIETNPAGQVWRTCLFLLDSQINAMPSRHRSIFASKTYLMIFRPGAEVADFTVEPWTSNSTDGFLWSDTNKVFTRWSANNLAYRFRTVSQAKVDAYNYEEPALPEPPVSDWTELEVKGSIWFMPVNLTVHRK